VAHADLPLPDTRNAAAEKLVRMPGPCAPVLESSLKLPSNAYGLTIMHRFGGCGLDQMPHGWANLYRQQSYLPTI